MGEITLIEVLELLNDYGAAINDEMARLEIFDDQSGGITIGTSERTETFEFDTIEELVEGLKNIRTK